MKDYSYAYPLSARAWILPIVLAILATWGCSSPPEGEAWAKKELGGDQAEQLRQEVFGKLQLGFSGNTPVTLPKTGKTPYLPRPYVVFEQFRDPKNPNRYILAYATLNKELAFSMNKPKGVAVLQKDTRSTGRDRKGRVHSEIYTEVSLIDLEKNISTRATINDAKGETARDILEALPASAP